MVKVGPNEKEYRVHHALLCASSTNFAAALNGGFQEGREKIITLADTSEQLFEHYVDWLYGQDRIYGDELTDELSIKLYIFADRYVIPQFKTPIIDWYIDSGPGVLDYELVIQAFTELPETSGLCRLIAEHFLEYYDPSNDAKNDKQLKLKQLPHSFLPQMYLRSNEKMQTILFGKKWKEYSKRRCEYHEHPSLAHRTACEKSRK